MAMNDVGGNDLEAVRTKGLGPLLAVNFAGSLGYTIVMPFLVFLVMEWGGNAIVFGLVSAAYSAFQLVGAPVLGRWSDAWGRKRVLLISQAGSFLSWVVALVGFSLPMVVLANVDSHILGKFTLTLPLVVLFLARALDGLTGGNVSVANAYVADISPEDQRQANFGKLAASGNLGEVLGPALAGFLVGTALGYELPVLFAAAVSLGATILVFVGLPKSKPVASLPEVPKSDGSAPSDAAPGTTAALVRAHGLCPEAPRPVKFSSSEALRIPGISCLLSACFLVNLAFSFFYIALPVHAAQDLHWSPKEIGWFFAVMSLVMVIVEGPVLRRASRVCSDAFLIAVGGLVLGVSFLFLTGDSDPMVFCGAILIAVGNGLMWPLIIALLSEKAGDHQGVVQGLAGSTGAVANIMGLIAGGVLYSRLGGWLFGISAGLAFLVMLMALWAQRSS
jgi:DHA1 family tetracycline resistance protein-like MFS transporter